MRIYSPLPAGLPAAATGTSVGTDTAPADTSPVGAFLHSTEVGVLRVEGELDMFSAPVLQAGLSAWFESFAGRQVLVDLSGVSFMDSAGLDPLLNAHSWLAQRGRSLRLRGVPRSTLVLLTLTGHLSTFEDTPVETPEGCS